MLIVLLFPRMSTEPEPLLQPSVQYGPHQGGAKKILNQIHAAENVVKVAWAKAVRVVRMREIFAEFLATFVLVVRPFCSTLCGRFCLFWKWSHVHWNVIMPSSSLPS